MLDLRPCGKLAPVQFNLQEGIDNDGTYFYLWLSIIRTGHSNSCGRCNSITAGPMCSISNFMTPSRHKDMQQYDRGLVKLVYLFDMVLVVVVVGGGGGCNGSGGWW